MMRLGADTRAALFAALVVLLAAPAAAVAALDYDLSLGASVNYTDNLHLESEPQEEGQPGPVQEMIYAVTPGLQFGWFEGRDHLTSNYFGRYLSFSGDEDRDPEWVHTLSAELGWRRWEPYFLTSGVTYQRVPRLTGDENESIVDQVDRFSFFVNTGYSWPLGATGTAELAYRGEVEAYSGGEGDDEDDRIVSHSVEGVARRRWGPLWEGALSARYGQVLRRLAEDSSQLNVGATLDHRFSERLNAAFRAEWVLENPSGGDGEDDTGTQSNFLASGELSGALERGGSWSLRYENRLQNESDGDTLLVGRAAADCRLRARLGSEIGAQIWYEDRNYRVSENDETAWGPRVTARWLIAPWAAFDLGGSWTENRTTEPGADDLVERTTRAAGAFVVRLGRQWVAEAGYVYRKNDSTEETDSYTANLFSAGVRYHFRVIAPGSLPPSTIVSLAFSDAMILQVR